jgi:Nif-specific regulatory protein
VLATGPTIEVKDLRLEPRRQTGVFPVATAPPGVVEASADAISLPAGLDLVEAERRYALATLEREGGNQSAAARALGISRNKLARLLRS